jgi:hypothetical protein
LPNLDVEFIAKRDMICCFRHSLYVLIFLSIAHCIQVTLLHKERNKLVIDKEKIKSLAKQRVDFFEFLIWITPIQHLPGRFEIIDHDSLIFADFAQE